MITMLVQVITVILLLDVLTNMMWIVMIMMIALRIIVIMLLDVYIVLMEKVKEKDTPIKFFNKILKFAF
jgi:hypothetical protein